MRNRRRCIRFERLKFRRKEEIRGKRRRKCSPACGPREARIPAPVMRRAFAIFKAMEEEEEEEEEEEGKKIYIPA